MKPVTAVLLLALLMPLHLAACEMTEALALKNTIALTGVDLRQLERHGRILQDLMWQDHRSIVASRL
jgi:hypothetical protein